MAQINPIIIKLLSEKCRKDVTTPAGASFLRNDIEAATKERISLNTIKRFVGILPHQFNHHPAIQDIIARYLGFESWVILADYINDNISFFTTDDSGVIDLRELPSGTEVEITWLPDRKILIRHIEDDRYIVTAAENSKLIPDDILRVSQVIRGFPFVVNEVIRNDKSLGAYKAALESGISGVEVKKDEPK